MRDAAGPGGTGGHLDATSRSATDRIASRSPSEPAGPAPRPRHLRLDRAAALAGSVDAWAGTGRQGHGLLRKAREQRGPGDRGNRDPADRKGRCAGGGGNRPRRPRRAPREGAAARGASPAEAPACACRTAGGRGNCSSSCAALPPGDTERLRIRSELVELHLPLVEYLARRFRNRGESLDDLTQVATIGLIKSVDRFDLGPRGGVLHLRHARRSSARSSGTSATRAGRSGCPGGCRS